MASRRQVIGRVVPILAVIAVCLVPKNVMASKINMSTSAVTLAEGQSQVITITLDSPIISSGSGFVTITITPTHPERFNLSTDHLTWTTSNWFTPQMFTVTAVDDSVDNGDITDVFTITTDSNAEYYANFSPALTVNVTDNDVAPIETPTVLPVVGQNGEISILIGLLMSSTTYIYLRHKKAALV